MRQFRDARDLSSMCPSRSLARSCSSSADPKDSCPVLSHFVAWLSFFLLFHAGTLQALASPVAPTSSLRISGGAASSASQTISFPQPPAPAYAGTSITLDAIASSGLSVSYAVISGPATINGSILTYTGAGTVVVEADQAGNGNFDAAAAVQDTVIVTLLTEPVGTASPAVSTSITFATEGTLESVAGLTQGAHNLDFSSVSGGSCLPGLMYMAGQTCTVAFTFTPTRPGLRSGAVVLMASDGTTLGNSYIYGEGTGPQLIFNPGLQSAIGSSLDSASGAAVNGNGDLFVSALHGQAVQEFPAAGGPPVPLGSFSDAEDIAVDGSGNVFVISGRNTVSEIVAVNGTIPPSPTIRTLASDAGFSGFTELNGIKVDKNGNVFVANSYLGGGTSAVFEVLAVNGSIPASPTILTLVSGVGGPTGVAVDASGDVFFSDQTGNAVHEIAAVNGSIPASPMVTQLGSGFSSPSNVALDSSGNVYVTDYGNQAVKEILAVNGTVPSTDPTIETLGSGLVEPEGLVVDASGNVFVADSGLPSVVKLDFADPPTLTFAATAVGSTSTDSPQTVTLINNGNAALAFLPPSAGQNPAITPGFTLSNSSTCPQLPASTNVAAGLGEGDSCTDIVSFTPVAAGADHGTLVTVDNDLNVAGATQTVVLNGTGLALALTISLTATPSPVFLLNPVVLTATVGSSAGPPSGTVTYSEGGTVLGSAALSGGVASLSVSTLGLGSHTLTATYTSSSGGVTSSAVVVTVQDFSLAFNESTLTIPHGGTATYSLVVSPIGGTVMPSAINLTISGAPDTSNISLYPEPVAAGSGSATITLTIRTPDYPVGPFSENRPTGVGVVLSACGLLLLCGRKRRMLRVQVRWIACFMLLLAASASLSACGSGWGTQQYTVSVTGSSGPLSHTATAGLISQ